MTPLNYIFLPPNNLSVLVIGRIYTILPPLTLVNKYSISNNSILLLADANKSEFACHLVRDISTQANDYCLLNIKMG